MRIGLDTSVVLRLILGEPTGQAEAARLWITGVLKAGNTTVVSDLVIAETYHALIYHYRLNKKEALGAIFQMLISRTVMAAGQAAAVLLEDKLATATPGFVDRLIHAGYLAEGDQWATFEKGASKMPKTMVLKAAS